MTIHWIVSKDYYPGHQGRTLMQSIYGAIQRFLPAPMPSTCTTQRFRRLMNKSVLNDRRLAMNGRKEASWVLLSLVARIWMIERTFLIKILYSRFFIALCVMHLITLTNSRNDHFVLRSSASRLLHLHILFSSV